MPETANVWTVVGNAAGPTFDVVALVTVGLILVGAYFLPTIVANVRKPSPPNVGSVVVINLFLGWTWIGWVVALALACRSAARSDGGSQDQRLTYPGAAGRRA